MILLRTSHICICIILTYFSHSSRAIRALETPERDARRLQVVNGQQADAAEYPFLVSLRNSNGDHTCGGTLIKSHIVLTAAHCVTRPGRGVDDFAILAPTVISSANVQAKRFEALTRTKKSFIHPEFNQSAWYDYDIAILILERNLTDASPIGYGPLETSQERELYIAGWGDLYFQHNKLSDQLMEARISRIPQSTCQQWGESFLSYGKITDAMLCAADLINGRDYCRGDSGGPLIARKGSDASLVGVNSWSVACGNSKFPGVYTSIAATREWIDAVVSR